MVVKGCGVSAILGTGSAVGQRDCAKNKGFFERKAHEGTSREAWGVGGGDKGEHVAVDDAASSHLLFHSRLGGVEVEVFPAMLDLQMCEGEAILQATGNLEQNKCQFVGKHLKLVEFAAREGCLRPSVDTLLTSARLRIQFTTSASRRFEGGDMAMAPDAKSILLLLCRKIFVGVCFERGEYQSLPLAESGLELEAKTSSNSAKRQSKCSHELQLGNGNILCQRSQGRA